MVRKTKVKWVVEENVVMVGAEMVEKVSQKRSSLLKKSLLSLQEKYGRNGVLLWSKELTGKMV